MTITCRHVFFNGPAFTKGTGDVVLRYTGQIYSNMKTLKNFNTLYSKNDDIIIACNDCAKRRYSVIEKVKQS